MHEQLAPLCQLVLVEFGLFYDFFALVLLLFEARFWYY
jgi:hypothetical protein